MTTKLFLRNVIILILLLNVPTNIEAQTTNEIDAPEAGKSDTVRIEYEELDWNCLCIPKNRYVIIKSYYDLNYFYNDGIYPGCAQIDTTMVDFNKEVIIGFHISLGGCPAFKNVDIALHRIDSEKKYTCTITNRSGNCKALFPYFKLFHFPITHKNYKIEITEGEYHLTQTRLNCEETHEKIINER